MMWKKDPSLKYTDMCIYIDKNIPIIAEPGKDPAVENLVYNYLWLLVKALAIKKRMFQNFEDYDGYAFHAASRLFFALRNNYNNQGKIIKGKQIRPIKSCLNYTKALLYPMKVEYQNETYNTILNQDILAEKFDSFDYKEQLKSQAISAQGTNRLTVFYMKDCINHFIQYVDAVLVKCPFQQNTKEYQQLKISLLLNCLSELKNKNALTTDINSIIIWKLPKSLSGYVKILYKELVTRFKDELISCMQVVALEDNILEKLISNTGGDFKDYEE